MQWIEGNAALAVDSDLTAGQRVKIVAGPLEGIEGELVRVKGPALLVVKLWLADGSVRVEVDRAAVSLR